MRLRHIRTGARSAPPTRPLHLVNARTISSRCFCVRSFKRPLRFKEAIVFFTIRTISVSVCGGDSRPVHPLSFSEVQKAEPRAASPCLRITARSMKVSSSRMLPGQSQAAVSAFFATGIDSIHFCTCLANLLAKSRMNTINCKLLDSVYKDFPRNCQDLRSFRITFLCGAS